MMGRRLDQFILELAEGARSIQRFDLAADLHAFRTSVNAPKSVLKPTGRDHAIVERIVRALETGQ